MKASNVFEMTKENLEIVSNYISATHSPAVAKRIATGYGLVIGDLRKEPGAILTEAKRSQRLSTVSVTSTDVTTHSLSSLGRETLKNHKAVDSYLAAVKALKLASESAKLNKLIEGAEIAAKQSKKAS